MICIAERQSRSWHNPVYPNVAKVMNAPAQVLAQVDGIGKVTANKIREVLDTVVP